MVQAAEIHGDEIAVLQNALGRNAVRQAGIRAGDGDGVERRAFGAVFVEPVDQLRAQLLLLRLAQVLVLSAFLPVIMGMAGNVGFDALLGAVPVVGDVADFLFRSNTRNLRIVKRHLDRHHPDTRIIEG